MSPLIKKCCSDVGRDDIDIGEPSDPFVPLAVVLFKAVTAKCPKEPLIWLFLDPYSEFGEFRIIELTSRRSGYGDDDKALFRLKLVIGSARMEVCDAPLLDFSLSMLTSFEKLFSVVYGTPLNDAAAAAACERFSVENPGPKHNKTKMTNDIIK